MRWKTVRTYGKILATPLQRKISFDLGGNRTHDLRIRSTVTLPTELRGRTEKVGDDLGGEFAQWVFHGFLIAL